MKKIEASKLNRNLKEVLDGIAAGERYEITRYGKTVAKMLPPGAKESKIIPMPIMTEAEKEKYGPAEEWKHEGTVAPTTEQIRQRRRDFLLNAINKPKPK